MANSNAKTKIKGLATLEQEARAMGGGLKTSVVDTLGKGGLGEAFNQLLAGALNINTSKSEAPKPQEEAQATTTAGVIFELFLASDHKGEGSAKKGTPEKPKAESRQEAALHYSADIKNSGEKGVAERKKTTSEQVADLKKELIQLAQSEPVRTKLAHMTLIQDTKRSVGKSDVSSLQLTLKMARMTEADAKNSGNWKDVAKGKGNKKGFGSMAKTHGTSFTQSNERTTIANSVG